MNVLFELSVHSLFSTVHLFDTVHAVRYCLQLPSWLTYVLSLPSTKELESNSLQALPFYLNFSFIMQFGAIYTCSRRTNGISLDKQ